MRSLIPLIIIGAFAAIVASLASALRHLARGDDSRRLVRALTWRIALSITLFILLMLAWYAGIIEPHGLDPGTPR
jgi:H+/Cl- antiporter ClcA